MPAASARARRAIAATPFALPFGVLATLLGVAAAAATVAVIRLPGGSS